MFKKRKNNEQAEMDNTRRARQRPQPSSPAFSYYTSRTPDIRQRGSEPRVDPLQQSNQPKRRIGPLIPAVLLSLVALVCAGKLVLLGTDPKIVVLGKNNVSALYLKSASTYEAAAQKLLGSSITNRTKITANLDGTAGGLKRQFPELQAVSVTLPLIGNRPIIYVEVAQPSVILQSAQGNYALNKSGLVLSRVQDIPAGIPLVVDQSSANPRPGMYYLPGSTISFISTVAYQLAAAKLSVSTYVLPPGSPYELDIRLEGQPYVARCNLVGDALTQSGVLIATLQHLGAATPANYIDVRVPDRVYYK
jgi:hypothetical protein